MNKAFTLIELMIVIAIIAMIAAIAIPNLLEAQKKRKPVPTTINMEEYSQKNNTPEFNEKESVNLDKRFIIQIIQTPNGLSNLLHITDTQTKVEYISFTSSNSSFTKLEKRHE